MTDPFAPPAEGAPRRHDTTRRDPPRPAYEPLASAGTVYEPPTRVTPEEERDARWRRNERDERLRHERDLPQPARPGPFWAIAGVGIGLLLLARLVLYFTVVDELPDSVEAPALFAVLGVIGLSAGLALAGLLQRGLAVPWRIALVAAAGFFAVVGGWPTAGFGDLL